MRYATDKQINFINDLQRYTSIGLAALNAGISSAAACLDLEDWSMADASRLIDAMIAARDEQQNSFGYDAEITDDMYACLDC